MTMFAVTDQIDDHVAFKFTTEITGYLHHMVNRFRIVGVNVKDRCMYQFGNCGAVKGRACVSQVAGGKPNLIVDDDMHGATYCKTPYFRHLE